MTYQDTASPESKFLFQRLWDDTPLHTSLSFDAGAFGYNSVQNGQAPI